MAIYYDEKRKTYYVSVYVELNNGERKRVLRRGFRTQAEAKRAEAEIILNSVIDNPDNPLFDDLLDEYMEWYEKRWKESTVYNLKSTIKRYIKPYFEDMHVQDIKKRDIMKFHDFLLEKLSVVTAKAVHKNLSAILNYAIQMEYLNINVAREVGNIDAIEERKINYWTLSDFKRFLSVIDSDQYYSLFMLLFYSGARIGEVLALTWSDVDFEKNLIDINKRYYKTKINTPKNSSSVRKIKLPNHTTNLLRQLKLQEKYKKDDYFIFGSFYKPLNQSTVSQQFYKYMDMFIDDEGNQTLKRIRIHDFRHSHASYLINKGYDIQIISKRLGHNKISTTYDIYAHMYPNKEDEAVKDMEDDFKPSEVIRLMK